VQYARAITKSIPNVFYSVGGSPPIIGSETNTNELYLEFLDYLLTLSNYSLPNTISISYGDDEDTAPLSYANSVCNLFAQLGARGVSVLVVSGESGVGSACTSGSTKTFTTSFWPHVHGSLSWVEQQAIARSVHGLGPEKDSLTYLAIQATRIPP
jgi:tripeptidyl-peptidase I